ncbi:MAG: glycosyltransferase family 1 protein [Bacteroidota bacterium]|nr:glycosyltransferase family 1 protein [Bacteroidota bacterium]
MKIAVNTRFLIKDKLEGIGVFTFETLKIITEKYPEHKFYFLFDRKVDKEFIFSKNIEAIIVHPQARHPFLWYLWFEWSLPKVLKKINADIFVSMDGYLPLRNKTKSLTVIHDLAFEHYPKDIPFLVKKYYKYYFPKFAQKADRIATVSEFSKNDLIQKYGIEPNKIDVVYNGASDIFKALSEKEKADVKKELTASKDYFVYVGALHQRKNIPNLLKAYEKFRDNSQKEIKLVIVGRKAWGTKEMEDVFDSMKYKNDIIFTGRVSNERLAKYIASAVAMTYVSYFEGFGIPLIEAFACNVPVITSNSSSLPEVVGDAGLIVNPFDVEEIAIAMQKIAEDDTLRKKLIEKLKVQKQKFSWDKTAELLSKSMGITEG